MLFGCAVAWPLTAQAQQPAVPVIGLLSSRGAADSANVVAAFHNGMKETGFTEGQTVAIEYRWAANQSDRLSEMVLEMIRARVTVIAAFGPPAALAAKGSATTIPIVFTVGSDPVKIGLDEVIE
jgi:putative ABC transport system substrate-binding protein